MFAMLQDSFLRDSFLRDSFGREFHYLRLSVTDVCNFRCTYCLPDGYQGRPDSAFLSLDEIRRVAAAFAATGTGKVRITGGEPSVRADLAEIIAAVKATPGIRTVALTTNGYRLAERIHDWAAAGLDALNLSIDSLDPAVFTAITGHSRLRDLLAGLDRALALGIPRVKVNAVLLRGQNDDQIDRFLDWIRNLPITLRFIELMQTGDNAEFFRRHHVSGEALRRRLLDSGWSPVLRRRDAGPAQEFHHPDYQGRIGLIQPYGKDFCATCNRLRVSALGRLHLCLFSEQGIDLRHLLQADDQREELIDFLRARLADKKISHFLHDGFSGGTRHLAMIGG
ncbi:MAG: cyclic pyranopterin monophosphate synthase [Porticoccaceae bacterium]